MPQSLTTNVNATADGDQTVLAAVPSRNIVVTGGVLVISGAAGTVIIRAATSNTALATFTKTTTNELVIPLGGSFGASLVQGEGVEINNGAGIDTTGFIEYVLI